MGGRRVEEWLLGQSLEFSGRVVAAVAAAEG
jgi:hypothetical protein